MFFKRRFERAAPAVENSRKNKKPRATCDQGQHDEQGEVVIKSARNNRDELIRNGREPFDENEPRTPFGVKLFQRRNTVCIAIEVEEPHPHRIEQEMADHPTRDAAGDRCNRADRGIVERPLRLGQRHRCQEHIWRDGEKGALGKRYSGQRPSGARAFGELQGPVIQASQHGAPLNEGRGLVHAES